MKPIRPLPMPFPNGATPVPSPMIHPRAISAESGEVYSLQRTAKPIPDPARTIETDPIRAGELIATGPAVGHGSSLFAPAATRAPVQNQSAIPHLGDQSTNAASMVDIEAILASELVPSAFADSRLLDLTPVEINALARLSALGHAAMPSPEQRIALARILGSEWPMPVKTDVFAAIIRVQSDGPALSQRRLEFFADPGLLSGYPPALISHIAKTAVVKNWKSAMKEYDFFSKFRDEPTEIFATIHERYAAFEARLTAILPSTLGASATVSPRQQRALFALELAFGNTQSATVTLALVNNPSLNHVKIERDERVALFQELLSAADAYCHGRHADSPHLAVSIRNDALLSRWFNPKDTGERTITLNDVRLVVRAASLIRESHDPITGEVAPISGRVKEFRLQTEMSVDPAFASFTAFPGGFPRMITSKDGKKAVIDPDGWYRKSLPDGSTSPCLVEIKSLRGNSGQAIVKHSSLMREGSISLQFLKYAAALGLDPNLRFHLRLATDMAPTPSVKAHLQNLLVNHGYSRAEAQALMARITVDVTPYK